MCVYAHAHTHHGSRGRHQSKRVHYYLGLGRGEGSSVKTLRRWRPPEASWNATGRRHPQWVYSKVRGSAAAAAQLEIPGGFISKDKPLSYEHTAELVAFTWEVAPCWKGTPECWCPELSPTTDLPL